ncbi:DNA dC-_dU-editing enzyme APOBEC-3B-like isoform X1 [Sceloporus undulatus]|uniref:DNA dC->dU-editing enzyme APOBEC-3B-like isoform X1 n=1 Tax=Sceloporus undulatus TaxID=8520 RepID=UPI001C4B1A84|nr:DNA dC->dU-editing enzyme APOBEC-3B-like isoform X1 [Sceloporus undulatus]
MPCFPKKLLPEKDFEENFNNTAIVRKTLVLFSLRKGSSVLWDTWGYAYNDPGNQHAELLVLSHIEGYIQENHIKGNYIMTLFMSYTPCHKCSIRITSFLASRNGLYMEIKASRLYFLKSEGQRGLCLLKRTDVLFKMMDRLDFEECFYLFVHPSKKFASWPNLDEQSRKNADDLDALWKQTKNEKFTAKEKKTEEKAREEIKIFNYDNMIELDDISACAALQLDAPEFSNTRIILESLCQTPEREGTQLSGPETPQKLNSSERITEASQIVKRKLDF